MRVRARAYALMTVHGDARTGRQNDSTYIHICVCVCVCGDRNDIVTMINHPNIVREECLHYIKLHVYDKIILKITLQPFIM